uniref:Fluoride-specific ion channel FluC n=1 Tax=Rhodopseudomonas palustris (strain BisA53) TaxID=316055 RepID=Q07MP6_RHOP5
MSGARSELRDRAVLYGYIAAGSVIGGWARYLVSVVQTAWLGPGLGFPWATLFVNVTGSFVIGFYATLTAPDGRVFASSRQRQLVMTGICGGYTTFSGFSFETFELLRTDHALAALINLGISPVTWLLAVWIGHFAATRLNRLKGS